MDNCLQIRPVEGGSLAVLAPNVYLNIYLNIYLTISSFNYNRVGLGQEANERL